MTQSSPIEPFNEPAAAIADYRQQAREFLTKSREYLADDDLHQASEKGWGAAAWMAKAVAEAQGWQYKRHEEFADVVNRALRLSGDTRLRQLRAEANELHGYFYTRKRFLDPDDIAEGLDRMVVLLDILEPLTENGTP
ncbi:MAG: hypothetical protein OXF79_06125 [Chloroflexi bacterium]|nr:hypothetical protein [Chloroflexota bacterium]